MTDNSLRVLNDQYCVGWGVKLHSLARAAEQCTRVFTRIFNIVYQQSWGQYLLYNFC